MWRTNGVLGLGYVWAGESQRSIASTTANCYGSSGQRMARQPAQENTL
jgi:hypothetical protein